MISPTQATRDPATPMTTPYPRHRPAATNGSRVAGLRSSPPLGTEPPDSPARDPPDHAGHNGEQTRERLRGEIDALLADDELARGFLESQGPPQAAWLLAQAMAARRDRPAEDPDRVPTEQLPQVGMASVLLSLRW